MATQGRKPPLGGLGWISSPERRETARSGPWPLRIAEITADATAPLGRGILLLSTKFSVRRDYSQAHIADFSQGGAGMVLQLPLDAPRLLHHSLQSNRSGCPMPPL